MSFLEDMFTIDVSAALANVVTLVLAFLVALPVGWDRDRAHRAAGIRTFSLVAVGSAGFMLIGKALGEEANMHYVLQGVMTGLGFLGAGVIIRGPTSGRVRGTTATAVALWTTAAIGAAIAYGRIEIALMLAALDVVGLRIMRRVQRHIPIDEDARGERPRAGDPEPGQR